MPEPTEESAQDKGERLAVTAAALLADLEEFTDNAGNQFVSLARRAQKNRRMIQVIGVSLIVDLVLSVILGLAWSQLSSNQDRINALTARLDTAQTTTRRATLCPLYSVLLSAQNPKSRAAFPQGPAAYDRDFSVLRQGYTALDCQQASAHPQPVPSITD